MGLFDPYLPWHSPAPRAGTRDTRHRINQPLDWVAHAGIRLYIIRAIASTLFSQIVRALHLFLFSRPPLDLNFFIILFQILLSNFRWHQAYLVFYTLK